MTFNFLSTLCPKTAPTAKSLASHIISKGRFQSGGCTIGAVIKAFLRNSKASLQSSSNTKGTSFWRRLVRGLVGGMDQGHDPAFVSRTMGRLNDKKGHQG